MKKVFTYLVALVLIGMFLADTSWSQRRRRQPESSESFDDLIYNEKIDERSDEEKRSDTDRLIDAVKSIKQKERESRSPEEREKETSPGPAPHQEKPVKKTSPAARMERGNEPGSGPGTMELENRPTLGIQVDSPDLLVDQEMRIQVRLNNSARIPYTAVAYSIKYDPAVLEVTDQSEDLPGVNIRDVSAADLGFALDPKSHTYINTVDPSQGLIHFMAILQADQSFSTKDGIVGEFTVRALRERGSTTLRFENVIKGIAIDATPARDSKE